jgi:low affinity Fe/Cu permease
MWKNLGLAAAPIRRGTGRPPALLKTRPKSCQELRMARQKNSKTKTAAARSDLKEHVSNHATFSEQGWFAKSACAISYWAGKPVTFLVAAAVVIVWAASGPVFGYSDTWQLVINTSTTIITFLMVFLIQNTQNRDTAAMQVKLAELIIRLDGADNKLAAAEDMSDEDLEQLHHCYKKQAEDVLASLSERRAKKSKAA